MWSAQAIVTIITHQTIKILRKIEHNEQNICAKIMFHTKTTKIKPMTIKRDPVYASTVINQVTLDETANNDGTTFQATETIRIIQQLTIH